MLRQTLPASSRRAWPLSQRERHVPIFGIANDVNVGLPPFLHEVL